MRNDWDEAREEGVKCWAFIVFTHDAQTSGRPFEFFSAVENNLHVHLKKLAVIGTSLLSTHALEKWPFACRRAVWRFVARSLVSGGTTERQNLIAVHTALPLSIVIHIQVTSYQFRVELTKAC